MKKKDNKAYSPTGKEGSEKRTRFVGYAFYPPTGDIYNQSLLKPDIDPADITQMKTTNEPTEIESHSETNSIDPVSGADLDIPGSELDNVQENIGSEDEENNYYSLGGDDHNDLEEGNGAGGIADNL